MPRSGTDHACPRLRSRRVLSSWSRLGIPFTSVNRCLPATYRLPISDSFRHGLACWPCVCRKLIGYEKQIFSYTETVHGRSSIPGVGRDLFVRCVQTGPEAYPVSYRMDAGPSFSGDKADRSVKLISTLCPGPGDYMQVHIFSKVRTAPASGRFGSESKIIAKPLP
jgi:hypothetical protein